MSVTATTTALTVNGRRHESVADPTTPLLYVLRDELGLDGPKFGCGLAQCGACTVTLGTTAIRSCVTPLLAVGSQSVTTVEGLGTAERPDPLQAAFIEEQAAQCGYCIPGMIMAAKGLLAEHPHPSETEIRTALAGNLCRCGTHLRIIRAVRRAASSNA